jgi:hypothetical protein
VSDGVSIFGDHVCAGCHRKIEDYEEHIHGAMHEFLGGESLGLDDVLGDFTYCSQCIQRGGTFIPEAHEVSGT